MVLVLTAAFALAGCPSTESVPETDAGESPDPSFAAVGGTEAEPLPRAPDAAVALAVDGEGLRLFLRESGAARPLPFGTPRGVVQDALGAVTPGAPLDEGTSEDCAADFVVWANGLTTWFVDDDFIGWSLRSDGRGVTTASGVGPGSTRTEVEASYAIDFVPSSTLGAEFFTGGLAGLFSSNDPDARVVALWAGQTCIAR